MTWRQYNGGQQWRTLEDGRIEVRGAGVLTTGGQPLTARAFLLEYGAHSHEAARRFGVPVPWIVGMASIEALRLGAQPKGQTWAWSRMESFLSRCLPSRAWRLLEAAGYDARGPRTRFRMDPVSLRYEDGYVSPEDTPGRVSAGLMQTLVTTARQMAHKHGLHPLDMDGKPREVALGDLLCPRLSILYGAAYMAHEMQQASGLIARLTEGGAPARGGDFVLMTGAYNAGGVKPDDPATGNPYGLLTYGSARTERAIQIHNDCLRAGAVELVEPWARRYPVT